MGKRLRMLTGDQRQRQRRRRRHAQQSRHLHGGIHAGQTVVEIPVTVAMAHSVLSCKPSDDVALAEAMMREARIHSIQVVDDKGAVVGIVSLSDIARNSLSIGDGKVGWDPAEVTRTLAAICEPHGRDLEVLPKAA